MKHSIIFPITDVTLNKSPSLPCSREAFQQGSTSTQWQRWSRVWIAHAGPQFLGVEPVHIIESLQYGQLQDLSPVLSGSIETFPTLSLRRGALPSFRYFYKYFGISFEALWAFLDKKSLFHMHNIFWHALMVAVAMDFCVCMQSILGQLCHFESQVLS